jgi:hypothetical protein
MALLGGKTRAVLETGGIEGLSSYDAELESAVADMRQVFGGAKDLSDETIRGIIKANAEKSRRGELLTKAREEDQRKMKLDLLERVFIWFSNVASDVPLNPLAWWGSQGQSARRWGISWDQFHAGVVFLAKHVPDWVKTVQISGMPTRYKVLVIKTMTEVRARLETLDLSGVVVEYTL